MLKTLIVVALLVAAAHAASECCSGGVFTTPICTAKGNCAIMGGTVCSETDCGDDVGRTCSCDAPASSEPEPECDLCGTEELGGLLLDHVGGGKRPPKYCLRLDNIGDMLSGAVTFSCEENGAFVEWWYDGQGGVTITGTLYGGRDGGSAWVDPELWLVEAYHQDLECCSIYGSENNDLCKKNTENGYMRITRMSDGEEYTFTPKIKNGESLLIGNGHRNEPGLSLWGWYMETPDARRGTQDWLAKATCAPKTAPPPLPSPPPPLPVPCCIQDVPLDRCQNNGWFANQGACCVEAASEEECQTRFGGEPVVNCYSCEGPAPTPPPTPAPAPDLVCCNNEMTGEYRCDHRGVCQVKVDRDEGWVMGGSCTSRGQCEPMTCEPITRTAGGGFLLTHQGGTESEPFYCLRLDDFKDQGKSVTFECDGPNGASVEWYHDGAGTLTIAGTVYGGFDNGNDVASPAGWTSPQLWNIYAVYTGMTAGTPGFTTTDQGSFVIWDDDELYEYTSATRGGVEMTLKLDVRTNSDARAETLHTIEGLLTTEAFATTEGTFRGWLGLFECDSEVDQPEDPAQKWCCTCSEFGVDRQCLPEQILDPSGGACGAQGVLECQALAQPLTCDDCQGQDPEECRPFNGTAQGGLMLTHAGGNDSPPDYCFRLDDFDGNTDTYTFECDDTSGLAGGASVEWYYDGSDRLVIAGQIYGGVEAGNVWTSPKLWNLYAVYTGIAPVAGIADATSAVIADTVVVYVWDDSQSFEYEGRSGAGAAGLAMIAKVNERTNLEPRAADHYTVTGYLTRLDQSVFGGAWLGLLECDSTIDVPEEPFLNWCCDFPGQGIQRECRSALVDPSEGSTVVCEEVETCDDCTPYTECVTDDDCDPCGVCSPQGMCVTDDSQRDPCGKCPGQSGFGECKVIECNVAFGECFLTKDINAPEALAAIEARIEVLEQAAEAPDVLD